MSSRMFYPNQVPTTSAHRLTLSTLSSFSATNPFLLQMPQRSSSMLALRFQLSRQPQVSPQPAILYSTQVQTIEPSTLRQPAPNLALATSSSSHPISTVSHPVHKNIEKVIRYCMLTMCVLMTASRIQNNYQRYSSYPVIISGRVYVSNTEMLPQLSVCFQDVIDPEKLMRHNPQLHAEYEQRIEEGTERLMRWISSTFTIRQVLQFSYDYDSYFYNCSLLSQDALKRESCNNSWQVWLTARRKCYSFFRQAPDMSAENADFTNKIVITNDEMILDEPKTDNHGQINSSVVSQLSTPNFSVLFDINKLPENQTLKQVIDTIGSKKDKTKQVDQIDIVQTRNDELHTNHSNETGQVASVDMQPAAQNQSAQPKPNYEYNRILLTNKIWVNLFIRKYNLRIRRKLDLLLQPPHTLLRVDRSNPGLQSLSTDYTKGVYISYERSTIARLPDPYATRCVDYRKSNFLDRAHCMYECESSQFVRLYHSWPDGLPIAGQRVMSKDLESLELHFNLTTPEESKGRTNGHQRMNCEQTCQHLDCFHEQLKLLKNYHKLDKYRGHPIMEVRLYLNSAPVTVLEYNPVYPSLNSQVQLFIGPASLWLGLSVFGIGRLIFGFVWKVAELGQKLAGQGVRKYSLTVGDRSKVNTNGGKTRTNKKIIYTDEFIVFKSRKMFDRIGLINQSFVESVGSNGHLQRAHYSPAKKRSFKCFRVGNNNQVVDKSNAL